MLLFLLLLSAIGREKEPVAGTVEIEPWGMTVSKLTSQLAERLGVDYASIRARNPRIVHACAPGYRSRYLHEGDTLLVQVLKDPIGTKGARLTTFITIPSRYLVYMPFGHGVGISARIARGRARQHQRGHPGEVDVGGEPAARTRLVEQGEEGQDAEGPDALRHRQGHAGWRSLGERNRILRPVAGPRVRWAA